MQTSFCQDSTVVTNVSVIKEREARLGVLTPLICEPKTSHLPYFFSVPNRKKQKKQLNRDLLSNPSLLITLNLRTPLRKKNC